MSRHLSRLVCSLLPIAALAFPVSAHANRDSSPFIERVNEIRSDYGLRPFKFAQGVADSSKSYSRQMLRTNSFSHASLNQSFDGISLRGEALAYRSGWRVDPGPVLRMWMNSPGHRALILSTRFRYAGGGRSRGRYGSSLATVWVLRFGNR